MFRPWSEAHLYSLGAFLLIKTVFSGSLACAKRLKHINPW